MGRAKIILAAVRLDLQGDASREALKRTVARTLDSVRLDAVGFERLRHQLQVQVRPGPAHRTKETP